MIKLHQHCKCGMFLVVSVLIIQCLLFIRAMETIRMAAQLRRPFFIGVGMIRPHLPFIAPESAFAMYNELEISITNNTTPPKNAPAIALNDCIFATANWSYSDPVGIREQFSNMSPYTPYPASAQRFLRHGYYAAITHVDAQLGRLLGVLDELSLADSTVVAFHGDHGWHLGEQGEWTKKTNFELGTRVPLFIRAPQFKWSYGTHSSELAELVDVYPTLAELAGLPPPPGLDGVSLAAAVAGTASAPIKRAAFSQFPQCPLDPTGKTFPLWHYKTSCQAYPRDRIPYFGYSVRVSEWRYTEWYRFRCPSWPEDCSAVWHEAPVATELYDYRGGPQQMTDYDGFDVENLADDPGLRNVTQTLHGMLRTQFNGTGPAPAA